MIVYSFLNKCLLINCLTSSFHRQIFFTTVNVNDCLYFEDAMNDTKKINVLIINDPILNSVYFVHGILN